MLPERRGSRLVILLAVVIAATSHAWYTSGHEKATAMAFTALKGRVPDFLYDGRRVVSSVSVDPDLFKDSTLPELKRAEGPEHYINRERLAGKPLPRDRRAYFGLCESLGVDAWSVGFLPYAVMEWDERLTIALAEYRAWPGDKAIQDKCMVYAGIMAHYAGDLTQPLHVTVHFDGKKMPDGTVLFHGIHAHVDGLLTTVADSVLPSGANVHPFPALADSVSTLIQRSASLVDTVYALGMPVSGEAWDRFSRERLAATATGIADFLLTAWEKSAQVKLPDWDVRGGRSTSGTRRSLEPN